MKKRRFVRFDMKSTTIALVIAISLSAAPASVLAAGDGTVSTKTISSSGTEFESKVVTLINIEREKEGLDALEWDAGVAKVARAHSKDMESRNYFSHTNQNGQSPSARMRASNISFRYSGENLARGHKTPEAVVTAWMGSTGHRNAILSEMATHIGVGFQNYYWTMDTIG